MKPPSTFFLTVLSVLFALSFINLFSAKKLFILSMGKYHFFVYFVITCLFSMGLFANFWGLPFAPQIARFAVFWFVMQVVVMPFWLLAVCGQMTFSSYYIKYAAVFFLFASFFISGYGTFYESKNIVINRSDLQLKGLDPQLEGFRIAQITDLHMGPYFSPADLRMVLDKTLEQKPDVLFVTGDLIDDTSKLEQMVGIFDEFAPKFPCGIYITWGNHEYIRGYDAINAAFADSKSIVLKNQNALLRDTVKPLYVIGIDYPFYRNHEARYKEFEKMLDKALVNVPQKSTKILLSHHSIAIDNAFERNIDITLSGHTHGTQVSVFGRPIYKDAFKYIRGMYYKDDNYGFVSVGVSSWFPFRFGCPPEIVIFDLKER